MRSDETDGYICIYRDVYFGTLTITAVAMENMGIRLRTRNDNDKEMGFRSPLKYKNTQRRFGKLFIKYHVFPFFYLICKIF